jgi:hypothetical protein
MTTQLLRALLALLAIVTAALAASAIALTGPASAAMYCVETDPTYYGNKQIIPAGQYCVPGP